jgi:hypothetical protein
VHLGGELDHQDGVLRGHRDQHQHADLEVDVDVQIAHPDRDQCAEHGERHGGDHGKGQGPALVLRSEDQENHEHAQQEGDRAGRAAGEFLEGRADPAQRVIAPAERLVDHLLHGISSPRAYCPGYCARTSCSP